jgi:hypothetical protein
MALCSASSLTYIRPKLDAGTKAAISEKLADLVQVDPMSRQTLKG